ncbi:MAG: hypothetical protein M0D55_10765 [Elusimicrobiota bacterium]|nr:MAG: hypothetical protein M0D55_10765 [Elusimicrobiota bacterium]
MTKAPLLLLLAMPAAADPAAMRATLEAMRSQAAPDPAALSTREKASAESGRSFDQSFTITTLAPVEYVAFGEPRKAPPAELEEKLPPRPTETVPPAKVPDAAPAPASDGTNTDYYFEGKQPVNGITIYTPKKGDGSTSAGDAPTDKYRKYGKWGMAGGAALILGGLLLGGPIGIGLAVLGGIALGAGAVLSFLFGKKK